MGNTASEIGNKRVILYTIHCPKCKILEKKLEKSDIVYEINEDIEEMMEKGFKTAPILEVDGKIYDFNGAIGLLRELGV